MNNTINKSSKELSEKYKDIVEEFNVFWKGQFLQELLKTNIDTMSSYLFDAFDKLKDDNDYRYEELVIIEQLFYQVYQIHYNSNSNMDNEILATKAMRGIKNIQNYLKSYDEKNNLLYGYLKFRKAEFYYYWGWHSRKRNEVITNLSRAIDTYFEVEHIFGIDIIRDANINDSTKFNGSNIDISAYYANTIGSAYNEMRCEEYYECAEYYCSCAVEWSEKDFENEVYKRNYGIALERNGKFTEAKEQYLKAVNSNKINSKNLHTLLSIIHKIVSEKLNIELYVNPEEDRKIKLCSDKYMKNCVNTLKSDDIKSIVENLQELKKYCQISSKIYPNNKDNYSYMTIYYIDCLILDFCNKEKSKLLSILNDAKRELEVLKVIAPYYIDKNGKKQNGLTEVLAKDIKSIEEEINKKNK